MKTISLEELLEAGCHFGHQVQRANPKAREFIFEARDGIHIIDLEKTKEGLEDAANFLKEVARKNGKLLVVGTKRQAQEILRDERKKIDEVDGHNMYFVTKRWIGGTLSNFQEVAKNFKKLKDLKEKLQDKHARATYTKKEVSKWDKERAKLESFYGGIGDMTDAPAAIFIIDTHNEHVAAGEALKMRVPTVGITDTNSDPMIISYPIPANDDAVGSLRLITSYIIDAWLEGNKLKGEEAKKAEAAKQKEEKKAAEKEKKTEEKSVEKLAEKPKVKKESK